MLLSIDEFVRDFEAIQEETRRLLGDVLEPAQLQALAERQDDIRRLLKAAYFGVFDR